MVGGDPCTMNQPCPYVVPNSPPVLAMTHLTVAFASRNHASDALRFLAGSSLAITATPRPCPDDTDLAVVDIDVPLDERERLDTLLHGVHALVIGEDAAPGAAAAA
jgi:hypothetical protein